MRLLITGASGYIATQFDKQYSNKLDIVLLSRDSSFSTESASKIMQYDGSIQSIVAALEGVDVVLHLATYYVSEHQTSDVDKLLDANVVFGARLLEAMMVTGVRKLVNIGTVWQCFEAKEHSFVNLYAASKQSFQEIANWYSDAKGLSILNLHLSDSYGRNDPRRKLINLLIEAIRNGSALDMSPGDQRISLNHISDVLNALMLGVQRVHHLKAHENETYSILQDEGVTIKELVTLVEQAIGKKLNVNWGGRGYREREVMMLPIKFYKKLPGWEPKLNLSEGIFLILRELL